MTLNKFGLSENNELFRESHGYPTIASLLDGATVSQVIPKPLKCECGHYPNIIKIGGTHNVRCLGCGIAYDFECSYSSAILQWNLQSNVPFDIENKASFHPYMAIVISDDLRDIKAATKAMNQKLFRQRNTKSKREKNLVSIMIDWNNFSVRMAQLLKINPAKFFKKVKKRKQA